MRQLDLFLDNDEGFYDELFSEVEDPEVRKALVDALQRYRAEMLNIPIEIYKTWIRAEKKN